MPHLSFSSPNTQAEVLTLRLDGERNNTSYSRELYTQYYSSMFGSDVYKCIVRHKAGHRRSVNWQYEHSTG